MRAHVPRGACGTVSRSRRPGRGARRIDRRRSRGPAIAGCSTLSTARRTTRTDCRSSARRSASRSTAGVEVAAVFDPTRRELFTAERGEGAYLNGSAWPCPDTSALLDSLLVTGFPYDMHKQSGGAPGSLWRLSRPGARRAAPRLGRARSLLRRGRPLRRLLGAVPQAVGRRGGRPHRRGGRGARHRHGRRLPSIPPRRIWSRPTDACMTRCSPSSATFRTGACTKTDTRPIAAICARIFCRNPTVASTLLQRPAEAQMLKCSDRAC